MLARGIDRAIADEDHRRLDRGVRLQLVPPHQEILAPLQAGALAAPDDGHLAGGGVDRDFAERYLLEPGAAGAARLESAGLELRRDIAGGQLLPPGCGAAPFQQVVRQEPHVRPERLLAETVQRLPHLGRDTRLGGRRPQKGTREQHCDDDPGLHGHAVGRPSFPSPGAREVVVAILDPGQAIPSTSHIFCFIRA